jgi:uncharacterized repeat protein (TIGR04076 family)
MAINPPGMESMSAEVVEVKGECTAGHKKGDRFQISCYDSGGLCGFFYHDIFPSLSVMQYGGKYPWASQDELVLECADRHNLVTLKLTKGSA